MASHEHAHPAGYKQYFMTWLWLLIMTSAALVIGYFHFLPEGIKAFLLVSITLAKIFLIGSIFMHLKSERVNLVMLTFSPLVLSIVLFFFTFGETIGTNPTHQLENQSPKFVMPTGEVKH
ncbi:MAG TPA: cytochrome C oxidase subunit IV family protein [Terriglobia bacterium]|nr:cytochrome C oxidase subunit IV family protein [Terriglobia bacterium]